MTLRDLIASDAANVVLNTRDLAETVTYQPAAGASRSVVVVVDAAQTADLDEDGGELQMETIHVTCMRDKDHARGGIDAPQLGDTIKRVASVEPDTRPYQYADEKLFIEPSYWTLVFWRYKQTSQGGR